MENNFVPYELALKLKELGFDEECLGYYDCTNLHTPELIILKMSNKDFMFGCSAPLWQQAFDWFREKYNLVSWVFQSSSELFHYSILRNGRFLTMGYENTVTYEEARLECLKKLIEIAKEKCNTQ